MLRAPVVFQPECRDQIRRTTLRASAFVAVTRRD
jgi:hypothetical protein